MKAKIKAIRDKDGWTMICMLPDGTTEYPQERYNHRTRSDVYADARRMYADRIWKWNESRKTINID